MKSSELLRRAKKRLAHTRKQHERGDSQKFICFAIAAAAQEAKQVELGHRLRRLIGCRLGRFNFYEDWLLSHHRDFFRSVRQADCSFQPGRHAWMNSLIKEFEAKGD